MALRLQCVADCLGVVSQALILACTDHSLGPFTPSRHLRFHGERKQCQEQTEYREDFREIEHSLLHVLTTHDGSSNRTQWSPANELEQPRRLGWSARTSNGGAPPARPTPAAVVRTPSAYQLHFPACRSPPQSQPRRRSWPAGPRPAIRGPAHKVLTVPTLS